MRRKIRVINGGVKITNPYEVLRHGEKQMPLFMGKERKCLAKGIETQKEVEIPTQETNGSINECFLF